MAINLSIPELIEGLINTQIFFTEEEQHVVKKEYLNYGEHTGHQIDQSDYNRLLAQSKTKIKDHLRIDVDNPPKYLVHALLRRCPIYLIPGIIRQPKFEDLFISSQKLLDIACMRLEYLVDADPEDDLADTFIINDLYPLDVDDLDPGDIYDIRNYAIEALTWLLVTADRPFLGKMNTPSFTYEKVLMYCVHAFGKMDPRVIGVCTKLARDPYASSESLYWVGVVLCDVLDRMDEKEEKSIEKSTPDDRGAVEIYYDEIIGCLISNHKVPAQMLKWLLRKVMQQEKYELAARILDHEQFYSWDIEKFLKDNFK